MAKKEFKLNQVEQTYWYNRIPRLYKELKRQIAIQVYGNEYKYSKEGCEIIRDICKPYQEKRNYFLIRISSGFITEEEFGEMIDFVRSMKRPEGQVFYEHE